MCNNYFDPNDLENQVAPCSGDNNSDDSAPEEDSNGNNSGNTCTSDLGVNNGGQPSCTSHKGPIEPQPNWGCGGLSIDDPQNQEENA